MMDQEPQRCLSRLDLALARFDDWWRGGASDGIAPAAGDAAASGHPRRGSGQPSPPEASLPSFRPLPPPGQPPEELSLEERRHSGGLMRVNHSGEVCAQALYRGQQLGARRPELRHLLEQSAREEEDHLYWCRERLKALGTHSSHLDGVWYALSWSLGAAAGLCGERLSLGFLAATEDRVCVHLRRHLRLLPIGDSESRGVLVRMLEEESGHGARALAAGGYLFPLPLRQAMGTAARLMTATSYWL